MIRLIKALARRIFWGPKASSSAYVAYLRKKGVSIGERTVFYEPTSNLIDLTRPFLIEIGDDVQVTHGVVMLTHGYDWSVLKHKYGDVLGSSGKVKIGSNVFIGVNTVILKGVTIGDNVIIGANSLVNKDVPDNCVAAGNPGKFVMDLDAYYEKRRARQLCEAKETALAFSERYGESPTKDIFAEFFWLFENGAPLPGVFDNAFRLTGNDALSRAKFLENRPPFDSYESFLEYCFNSP